MSHESDNQPMPIRIAGFNVIELTAGLVIIGIGIATIIASQSFGLGTTRNVGPGALPMLIGGLLVVMGAGVILEGRTSLTPMPEVPWRALLSISLGLGAFGLLIERAGAIAAIAALIILSSFAEQKFRPVAVVGISVFAIGFAALLSWAFYGALTIDLLPRSR